MKNLSVIAFAIGLSAVMAVGVDAQESGRGRRHPRATRGAQAGHVAPKCGDALAFQVLLDRHGFSSGEIDGKTGANTKRALAAFQEANKLTTTSALDCETWSALGGENQKAPTTTYTITDQDAAGPFVPKIPAEIVDQAGLAALGYTSLEEKLAERFHVSPSLLSSMNNGVRFAPGATITVPDVEPFEIGAKPTRDPAASKVTVEVDKAGTLRVVGSDGQTRFFAPVTSGSSHDPLPIGTWKVTTVAWMPVFHYNPELFWDAKATDTKAEIKPGPNNPVGVVWIDLSAEHYGIHGTPEPSRIGYTQSHGCVRLTNWDAARVAAMVGPNTPVIFK